MRTTILYMFLTGVHILSAQTTKDQLVGRVLDIFTNQGIKGVQVELITEKTIVETNADGVFMFKKPGGFRVGEAYSFNLYKEGYLTVGHTDNIAMYSSGAINDFAMKPDINRYLWLTVVDGDSRKLLEGARIQVRDSTRTTDSNGMAKLDLKAYRTSRIRATIRLDCYHDEIIELPVVGERTVKLVPKCENRPKESAFDISSAQQTLDRALDYRDGSLQGQVKAIEGLLQNGYVFNNTNFDGVAFPKTKLNDNDFTRSSFQFSNLKSASFRKSKLDHANLNFAQIPDAVFDGVIARETFFQYMGAKNASFKNATLAQSSFLLSDLSGADFSNADLRGACLAFCNLTGANFSGADLTDAYFYSSVLNKADFSGAKIQNTEATFTVADTLRLSDLQRRELRRIAPPANMHQVRIWGKTRDEKGFDYGRPDFELASNSFDYAHFRLDSNTLSFRDETSMKPIGTFGDYKVKGGSYMDTANWFDSKFWNTANRGTQIKAELKARIKFLRENLWKQKIIEGSGEEMDNMMNFLRKKKSSAFKNPLRWDEDAQLVLSLASGLKDSSEIEHYQWEQNAKGRCYSDSQREKKENSWVPLYPTDCHCDFLPYEQLRIYKKWTLERASKMTPKTVVIKYPTNYSSMVQFIRDHSVPEADHRGMLFNRKTGSSRYGISYFFHHKNLPYKKEEFFMSQPVNTQAMYLKLPKSKFSYYIDLTDLTMPKLSENKTRYEYPLDFVVHFAYEGMESFQKYNQKKGVLMVTPLKAVLKMDGKTFWEGKIYQTDEKLYDPAAAWVDD